MVYSGQFRSATRGPQRSCSLLCILVHGLSRPLGLTCLCVDTGPSSPFHPPNPEPFAPGMSQGHQYPPITTHYHAPSSGTLRMAQRSALFFCLSAPSRCRCSGRTSAAAQSRATTSSAKPLGAAAGGRAERAGGVPVAKDEGAQTRACLAPTGAVGESPAGKVDGWRLWGKVSRNRLCCPCRRRNGFCCRLGVRAEAERRPGGSGGFFLCSKQERRGWLGVGISAAAGEEAAKGWGGELQGVVEAPEEKSRRGCGRRRDGNRRGGRRPAHGALGAREVVLYWPALRGVAQGALWRC